ncbi:PREDICTED: uncharacterized protein LOC106747403 [Dinoponera quadriceps]|uniref:Uncharacterized protein LOC106747403 n=1 Tax=Dinoponera quadriceps TaxID=609295 RepID=A0A6P3XR24_DINQU|nr:PREDICTED: uncharacterized protein LOC106747403 [Dinoponera quadriceps]
MQNIGTRAAMFYILPRDYVRHELDAVTSSGVSSTENGRQQSTAVICAEPNIGSNAEEESQVNVRRQQRNQLAMALVVKAQLPPSEPPLIISSWQLRVSADVNASAMREYPEHRK